MACVTKDYTVTWTVEISAESSIEAAEKAREIQLDPKSMAIVFNVNEKVDLCTSTLIGKK